MQKTTSQFFDAVLPASADYLDAEEALSAAFHARAEQPDAYQAAERRAVRKASELAIALFSLVDRAAAELDVSKKAIRQEIADNCLWQDSSYLRKGAESRVRSVADAYKHHTLDGPGHAFRSADDVLACGLSYGRDGYGVGKYSGAEVFVTATDGEWKFLGDAHVVLRSWKAFLSARGVNMTSVQLPL